MPKSVAINAIESPPMVGFGSLKLDLDPNAQVGVHYVH